MNRVRIAGMLVFVLIILLCGCGGNGDSRQEAGEGAGSERHCQILVGDRNLADYSIVLPERAGKTDRENAGLLQEYIYRTGGFSLPIVKAGKETGGAVRILRAGEDDASDYEIYFEAGDIYLAVANAQAGREAVYDFANTYLGWAFAGEAQEHISSRANTLCLPADKRKADEVWMEEREAIVCLWKTNTSRGAYYNGNTSLKSDLMSYSEDQLYEYIKMLKYCGFTGIQVTDMCSNWAAFGGYEFAHERIRYMAEAAHSLNMKFTLWVWGAEFTGYGWVDPDVVYADPSWESMPRECEDVRATFEKYYTIYAELADCSDRLIVHYADPGKLAYDQDIAFFAGMLRDKVREVNPDIIFGVSCWTGVPDRNVLTEYLGTDLVVYEGGHMYDNQERTRFRTQCQILGLELGTWAWNTAEMEIDQLAEMNVNAKVLQKVYQEAVETGDTVCKSSYWSEMDSYHMLNLFSLYCAGHLLQDPYADTDELLRQVACDMAGENHAEDMYQILSLIQDARSGDCWETFYWSCEDYLLLSDDYPAEDILQRADRYIPVLEEMIEQGMEQNMIPMPISTTDMLQLIMPHLQQIRHYAAFRADFAALKAEYARGMEPSELSERLSAIYEPVPEYNCIIGMWGQPEARAQYELLKQFCQEAGVDVPQDSVFCYYRKQRIYQEICSFQKGSAEIYYMQKGDYQLGLAFGRDETERLVEEMVSEGLLQETGDGRVYLTDWENYRFHFN